MRRIFVALVGVFLVLALVFSVFWVKVRSVSCQAESASCPDTILETLNGSKGSRLLGAENTLRLKLKKQPEVASFSIRTSLLGDISVNLKLRDPGIAIKPENGDKYTLYTNDGVVVKETVDTNLPVVLLKEQVSSENISFVVVLVSQLTKMLPIKSMMIEGGSLKIELLDGRKLIYPVEGDIDLILGKTVITFSQLNQESGKLIIDRQAVKVSEIDFRFKNPVLR